MAITLLLVDDDDLMAEIVRHTLKPLADDITIVTHHDADEQLASFSPDLILSDLRLLTTQGESTPKALRQYFSDTPIILMSGVEPIELAQWTSTYNLQAFICKDDIMSNLADLIQPYLRS